MINNWTGMGRLTKDPELRHTGTGKPVATFTLAIDEDFVNSDGEKKCNFINIVAWGNTAEFVSKYFHKGNMIAVQGRITSRTYEQDGNKRYITEVVAEKISFTGERTGQNQSEDGDSDDFIPLAENDDDLPF
ncbi:MAG: single-stranded DNA-binding protein [Monoglobaceae bacterium]